MGMRISVPLKAETHTEKPIYLTRAWCAEMSKRLSDGEPAAKLASEQGLSIDALRHFINRYYTQRRPAQGATEGLGDTQGDDVDSTTQAPVKADLERTEGIIGDIRKTGKVTQVAKKYGISRARVYQLLDAYYKEFPDKERVSANQSTDDTDDKIAEWVLALLGRGATPESIVKARPSLTLEGIAAIESDGRYGARQQRG